MHIVKFRISHLSSAASLGGGAATRVATRSPAWRMLALCVAAVSLPVLQGCGQKGGLTLPVAKGASAAASAEAVASAPMR